MKFFLWFISVLSISTPSFGNQTNKKTENIKSKRSLGTDENAKVFYVWISDAALDTSQKFVDECTTMAEAVAKLKNFSLIKINVSDCAKNTDNGFRQLNCNLSGIRVFENSDACASFLQMATEGE